MQHETLGQAAHQASGRVSGVPERYRHSVRRADARGPVRPQREADDPLGDALRGDDGRHRPEGAARVVGRFQVGGRIDVGRVDTTDPNARISSTREASPSSPRAETTTFAPRRANRAADSRPMPLEAPMRTTTCSSTGLSCPVVIAGPFSWVLHRYPEKGSESLRYGPSARARLAVSSRYG